MLCVSVICCHDHDECHCHIFSSCIMFIIGYIALPCPSLYHIALCCFHDHLVHCPLYVLCVSLVDVCASPLAISLSNHGHTSSPLPRFFFHVFCKLHYSLLH